MVRENEEGDVEEEWQLISRSGVVGCTKNVCGE